MLDSKSTDYINSSDYQTLLIKIKELQDTLDDLRDKSHASRKLRYADIDIEAERLAGRLQPDELYIPQHVIDTNIRREQSPYIEYITKSPRAVVIEDVDNPAFDMAVLEKDLSDKIRFEGWQLSQFANIDSFQANGYGFMELVYDKNAPGGVAHEFIQYGDFAFTVDTRDIQQVEMTSRAYYYTRSKLVELCGNPAQPKNSDWSKDQVDKLITSEPTSTNTSWEDEYTSDKKSLYRVFKVMFRIAGIVHVAWVCPPCCSGWIRSPRPLYIGARKQGPPATDPNTQQPIIDPNTQQPVMTSVEDYETEYPYFLFPYLISENDTIAHLHGRVFLDQDMQEAVSSLISSTCTQARRAAGMYFGKDVSDPNDDILMQKNVFFKSGCIVNNKITAFKLDAPDPSIFSAIQMLMAGNQNETSQVNFAVNNRQDSRKTAKEIEVATQQATVLSTVQVVLFSLALKKLYTAMSRIIKSRVLAPEALVKVNPTIKALYARNYIVKPAGDADVIEKQQLIQTMMSSWPVVQNTPASVPFLSDLIELMFPLNAPKYLAAFAQAQQQQQSSQAQQQQQMMQLLMGLAKEIMTLDSHPEFFSETGRVNAYPIIQETTKQLKQMEKQMKQAKPANGPPQQQQPQLMH